MKKKYLNYWAYNRDLQRRKRFWRGVGIITFMLIALAIGGTGTFPY